MKETRNSLQEHERRAHVVKVFCHHFDIDTLTTSVVALEPQDHESAQQVLISCGYEIDDVYRAFQNQNMTVADIINLHPSELRTFFADIDAMNPHAGAY